MANYEEIKTSAINVFLLLNDIVEKTNKFRSDDIDKFASSAVTSKRSLPLIKKMYELEEMIGRFRSDISRAVMLNAKAGDAAAASDDPTDTSVAPAKSELPTIAPAAAVAAAAAAKTEDGGAELGDKAKKPKEKAEKPKVVKADEKSGGGAKTTAKPTLTEAAPSAPAAPLTIVVPSADSVLPEAPPSPTNSASDKAAGAKKGGRQKKAAAETSAQAPPVNVPVAEPAKPAAAPAPTPVASAIPVLVPAAVPVPAVAPTEEVKNDEDAKAPLHIKRKKIPKAVRVLCWNLHVGSHKGEDRCMCCKEKKIDIASFHCGHVLAESKGGDLTIKNLRPICASCNSAMGTRSMNEFTKEFFGWEI